MKAFFESIGPWVSAHPEIVIWVAVSMVAWIWHFVAREAATGSVRWGGVLKLMQSVFGDLPKAQEAVTQIITKKLPPMPSPGPVRVDDAKTILPPPFGGER